MENKKNQHNKWLTLINIPIQMGVVIFLFSYLGNWLDLKYQNSNQIYTKTITIVGVFLALFNVIRQINQLNNKEDDQH